MNKCFSYFLLSILFSFIIFCVHYTILNATWLIGDDAIIIRRIGIGIPFHFSDTIIPSAGRFFPFAYIMYDLLLLFFDGWISANVVYAFQVICYVVGMMLLMFLFIVIQKNKTWNYTIAVLSTIFIGARMFSCVINCYATTWFDMFTQPFIILFFILFCKTNKNIYGILSLMMIIWCTYCSEIGFALPFVLGVCGLILRWKDANHKEKTFYWLTVANAVIFLSLYYFLIRTKTEVAYDPAHGSGVSFWGNVLYVFRSQKFFWVVLPLLCVRIWNVLFNKDKVSIYDILLLAATGYCCACFILKLNWVLYYHKAIIFALPAVIYYCNSYFKSKITTLLMFAFAVFYCSKMPKIINENQCYRINTDKYISCVVDKIQSGNNLYWYAPAVGVPESYENVLRDWIRDSFQTLVGWNLHNMEYKFNSISIFNNECGYYLLPANNDRLQENTNSLIEERGEFVAEDNTRGIKLYKVE